jgi:hypothetical protein
MAVQQEIIRCPAPATDHLERFGFLFGYPIAHSLSPLLHQTVFQNLGLNWDYFPLPSTDVESFLKLVRDPRCYGKLQSFLLLFWLLLTSAYRLKRDNASQGQHHSPSG